MRPPAAWKGAQTRRLLWKRCEAQATALRRGRNHLLCTHRLALPGGGHLMVNTAKRKLRRHVDADWTHARGMAEEHPDDRRSRHRRSRPQDPHQFAMQWTAVCYVKGGRLYYRPRLMPRGYDGDGSSGVNNDEDSGDEDDCNIGGDGGGGRTAMAMQATQTMRA